MEDEKTVCELRPSQLVNLKVYIFSLVVIAATVVAYYLTDQPLVLAIAAIPILYSYFKFLQVYCMKLKVTDQRLIISKGILNKVTNETELYRVRDSSIEEPFFYRIFGLGNIIVYTTDEANGTLRFNAFKKPHWLKDQVRNYSEICRQKKRWGNDTVLFHDHIA